ncbi:hypothetical protein KC867_00425 [Candidatus Saccharibacteria bacterium]|nr:hypothetical protein [Candidatus Saccharibacteria bacterium]
MQPDNNQPSQPNQSLGQAPRVASNQPSGFGQPSPTQSPSDSGAFGQPPVPAPLPPKKSHKVLILAILALLVIVGFVATYFVLASTKEDTDQTDSSSQQVSQTTSSGIAPIDQIDELYGQYRIEESDFVTTEGFSNTPWLHTTFDETTAYFDIEPETWRHYQFKTVDESGLSNACVNVRSKYDSYVEQAIKAFADAGYEVETPVRSSSSETFYAQYENCNKGAMLQGDDYTCSVELKLDSDVTTKIGPDNVQYIVLDVACSQNDSLAQDKELANKYQEMSTELSGGVKETGFFILPGYIKDSQTDGYKIAQLSGPMDVIFYYKDGDNPWVKVELPANTTICAYAKTDAELTAIFKGETCENYATNTTDVIE